jgi:hypothetical protein
MPGYCESGPRLGQGRTRDNNRRVLVAEPPTIRQQLPIRPHPIPTLAVPARQRRNRRRWLNAPHPHLPGLEASERSWTLLMRRAKLPRQRNGVVRSMSGASQQSRLSGRPRHVGMTPWALRDRLPNAANPNRTGERSYVTSWLPRRLAIIAGRHPIGATSHRACTCHPLNDGAWERS